MPADHEKSCLLSSSIIIFVLFLFCFWEFFFSFLWRGSTSKYCLWNLCQFSYWSFDICSWRPDLFLKLKQLSVGLLCSFVMLRSLWRKKIFSILGIVCSRIAPIASSHEIFSDWRSLEILLVPCVWYAECHMLLISEVGIRNDSYNQPAWAQCIYI